MNKVLGFLLAAVAVLGLSTAQVLARGGGHGGGHHGGGHHGGGHHGGHHSHHSSHHHTGHHSHTHSHHGDHHHYHHSNWAHHNRPFSHGWYGRHGGAWGYGWGGWGWGNPWAVSTFGATAAWLGLDAAEPYYGNYGTVDNYLTSDESTEPEGENSAADNTEDNADDNESTSNDAEANDNEENESAENDSSPSPITPEQIASAKQLIADGKNDPPKDTSFLPLGVFSIAPEGQHEASALVQLAVSKAGQVRGTYYDLLTDHDQPIRGAVNKKTQQVAFTFGDKGKVTFETSLANLTQETGAIAAHFENGQTSTWTLARYAKEPSENEAGEATPAAQPQSETAVQ